jgi:hypothetical protein
MQISTGFARRPEYEDKHWCRCPNPVRFILTPGQVHDILQAQDLISGFPFENGIGAGIAFHRLLSSRSAFRSPRSKSLEPIDARKTHQGRP